MTEQKVSRSPPVSVAARVAAQCLRVDHATIEVVTAIRVEGVRPILLKGPAVVDLLYREDSEARPYLDVDLLVAPEEVGRACDVLGRLGYTRLESARSEDSAHDPQPSAVLRHETPRHAEAWVRGSDCSVVDLHRTIHGAERLDPRPVWHAIAAAAVPLEILGVSVEVPSVPTRLLHLVLHLRPRDHPRTQAWRDLERAVKREIADWERAASLARSLGLDEQMGPLLRLLPIGERLAGELRLPAKWPVHLRIEYTGARGPTRFFAELAELGWHERAHLVGEKLLPPPSHLKGRWPLARQGSAGLVLTYAYRVALIPKRLVEATTAALGHRGGTVEWDSNRSRFTTRQTESAEAHPPDRVP